MLDELDAKRQAEFSDNKLESETPQDRYERKRRLYLKSLHFRISEAYIAAEGLTWTPTLDNRDEAFTRRGRETLVAALKRISYDEHMALADYIADDDALAALLQHGQLPAGLKDHWRHPIRGGGSLKVENVCLMTQPAHDMLKQKRIDPAIHAAYKDSLPEIEHYAKQNGAETATRLEKIELFAASFLANPRHRRIPFSLVKPIKIGIPQGIVCIGEKDFDLRESAAALDELKHALDNDKPHRPRPKIARQPQRHPGRRR